MKLSERFKTALDAYFVTGQKAAALGSFMFPSSYTFSGKGGFVSIAPRNFPYQNTDAMANSAVMNTLGWAQRNFGQAHLCLEKETVSRGKKKEEKIVDHPFLELLWNPNPYYSYHHMWSAVVLSYLLDGNAYLIKARNARGFGVPTALWYEPHWTMRPHAPSDGSAFVDYYERFVNGTVQKIPVENVIHFRNGLNPANPRYGLSPLKAALLEIFTDTEVSLWVAALCKNMAIPGVVVSPEQSLSMGKNGEKAEQIKQAWKRKFGGDNRGEPLILDFPASVTTLGYNPSDMDFAAISNKAETRISGALGVPAIVAGLSAGLDSSTYNNLAALKRTAFEECLCPLWENFETTLDTQLLTDFTNDKAIETSFETDHIRALQESETERQDRERKNLEAGTITLNEYRERINQEPIPEGDIFYLPNKVSPVSAEVLKQMASEKPQPKPAPNDPANDPNAAKNTFIKVNSDLPGDFVERLKETMTGVKKKSLIEFDGMELWREPTELEKTCIKSIDAAMSIGKQSIEGALLSLRDELIAEAVSELGALSPENYHALVLSGTDTAKARVQELIFQSYNKGRDLVRGERAYQMRLSSKDEPPPTLSDKIAQLAAVTVSRLINEVQTRAIEIAARLALLFGKAPDSAELKRQIEDTSTGYVSKAASGAANVAIAEGRKDEAATGNIERVYYSAILDSGTCLPCIAADGTESESVDNLPPVPNPLCDGSVLCRCVHVYVFDTEV